MRAPFQVLIFPYISVNNTIEYCLFRRSDSQVWQGVSGGGEDTELPIEAAKRETAEETKICSPIADFWQLNSIANIPVEAIGGPIWGEDISEVPEYAFGLHVKGKKMQIGAEHTEYKWFTFSEAFSELEWQSNKNAITELNALLISSNRDGQPFDAKAARFPVSGKDAHAV